ncbi:MAG: hypothetical protein IPM54_23530 [Polyangiaceae bacterium]|nr:hypothetical protein [Polyangiaceae bacterium]
MGSYEGSGDRYSGVGLANRLCRVIPALRDIPMRTAVLQNDLDQVGVQQAARTLEMVARRAEQADPAAREVIAAVTPILSNPERKHWIVALRQIAKNEALLSLARLLMRRAKPVDAMVDDHPGPQANIALEPGGRPLSLGERRALARMPSRATLDKLLADPHPLVIQNLLGNPRLTEDDVVRMAARRPARREVIAQIARSPVWMTRARVRMAIVLNPGTPPEIAVPILSQLLRSELSDVVASTLVPTIVRGAARGLLERRPPLPPDTGEGEPQVQ